jgi:hypothetical protein
VENPGFIGEAAGMPCEARALSSETPTGSKSRDHNAVHDLHGRTYD